MAKTLDIKASINDANLRNSLGEIEQQLRGVEALGDKVLSDLQKRMDSWLVSAIKSANAAAAVMNSGAFATQSFNTGAQNGRMTGNRKSEGQMAADLAAILRRSARYL